MAADLEPLDPAFRARLTALLAQCITSGYEMRICCGLRDPYEQARLWRQSRTREEIEHQIAEFNGHGAGFLADCLSLVGPQQGRHATDELPGYCWHQWGTAADCYWVVNRRAEWSTSVLVDGRNGYHVFAALARECGLLAAGSRPDLSDWPHVQLYTEAGPFPRYSLKQINDTMKQRFGR